MIRNLNTKATTVLLTLAMLTSTVIPAFADNWYLEDGDITVTAASGGQTVTQDSTTKEDENPIIQNRNPDTATGNTVSVESENGKTAELTIQNVNISAEESAIDVGDADARIQINGNNTMTSTEASAIHVTSGSVTIEGEGSLRAASTENSAIGADEEETMSGRISVQGNVTVNAYGGDGAAAIGAEESMTGSIAVLQNAEVNTGVVDSEGKILEGKTGYIGAGSESDHTHNEGSFSVSPSATVNGASGTETEELLSSINAYVDDDGNAVNLTSCEHSYTASVTEPTCQHSGYTTYTCELCGDSYTANDTDPVDHDYSLWVPSEDSVGTHLQVCKYCGKGSGESADCDMVEIEVDGTVYAICTVCGSFGDDTLASEKKAVCRIGKSVLEDDAVIVRGKEEPFGSNRVELGDYDDSLVLIDKILTVTMNNESGSPEDPEEKLTVTVPYSKRTFCYSQFKLLCLLDDGSWEEVEYTHSGNELSFETEKAGVWVIVY